MVKKHAQGLFAAQIAGELRLYRIAARLYDGSAVEFEDPYRFPPLLSDFDLHLHGEGTHYETYNSLGAHIWSSSKACRRAVRGLGAERGDGLA